MTSRNAVPGCRQTGSCIPRRAAPRQARARGSRSEDLQRVLLALNPRSKQAESVRAFCFARCPVMASKRSLLFPTQSRSLLRGVHTVKIQIWHRREVAPSQAERTKEADVTLSAR